MRVLVATSARGPIGGVETYLRGVVPALIGRGHDVALLYERRVENGRDGADPYAACSAEWSAEGMSGEALERAARDWRPALIWLNGLRDGALEQALLGLAPAIAYAHNYDGLCATGTKSRAGHACGRRMGAACGVINFAQHCGSRNPATFLRQWRRERERARHWPGYARVLVASRHMAATVEQHGVEPSRVRRVGYPRLEPRAAVVTPRPGPAREVLMLARLTRVKGGDVLLQAARLAEQALGRRLRLTIAGNGPEQSALEQQARRWGLEATFPGWVEASTRRRLMAQADVLAVPSLWAEPFGMTGLEAAGWGVPAVGFAHGGIPDWLHAGDNGGLAPADPPTAAGLAAALTGVLGDAVRWNQLRQGAWRRAEEFALEPHLDQLETIFREVGA